jgi:hypothetical protein
LRHAFDLDAATYQRLGGQAAKDAKLEFNEPLRLARTLDASLRAVDPWSVSLQKQQSQGQG